MAEVLFFLAGISAIAGAIGVIALRNPFYSVLALVCHLLALATLFLLLHAEFVAAAQVVVYAGAVMVLYVFVVAYVGGQVEPIGPQAGRGLRIVAAVFGGALFIELCIATLGSGLKAISTEGPKLPGGFGSANQMGELLLTRFLLAFEVASFLLLIAAVGRGRARAAPRRDRPGRRGAAHQRRRPVHRADRLDGRGGRRPAPRRAERPLVDIGWYLVVSALIFTIGAAGVLTRRSPLVILLCLELMLNAGNLALIAFSRMHGNADGQVFAVVVMVVAACEVTVGLGLIVAMYRRRLPIDVDEMRELQG